jgi:hypothetical protein
MLSGGVVSEEETRVDCIAKPLTSETLTVETMLMVVH